MVWIELLSLAGVGCAAGLALGGAATAWLAHTGVVYPIDPKILAQFGVPDRLYPTLTPFSAFAGPAALFAAIAAGGLAPYLRVMGLTAAGALKAAA
jgi:hypothetical protein